MASIREQLLTRKMQREQNAKVDLSEVEKIQHGIIDPPPAEPHPEPEDIRPRRDKYMPEIVRKLPHSLEAEMGILGSILVGGRRAMYIAERAVDSTHFHDPRCSKVFDVLKDMHGDNESLDLVTLTNELERREILEEIGGASFVTSLFTFIPTAANLPSYVRIVVAKHALRLQIALGQRLAAEAYLSDADPQQTIQAASEEMAKIERIVVGEREESEEFSVEDLAGFDAKNDPNSVLGYRWLCRGAGCLMVGQSGLGKSSLAMQAGILWAQALPLWGVKPTHGQPLKSLYIQAENDRGDMAEMMQGVLRSCQRPEGMTDADFRAELSKRMIFHRDATHSGPSFARAASRLIDKYQPDLVWLDPLLSYAGDDISKQAVASAFLRQLLNPIALSTGVIWMLLHHTGKPPTDPKARSGWTDHDFSYQAFGSSELVNWARAVNVLRSVGDGVFELRFSKRGKRAGLREYDLATETDPESGPGGKFTDIVYLQHAREGIFWEQIEKPADLAERGKARANDGQYQPKHDANTLVELLRGTTGGRKTAELQRLAYEELNISRATFYRLFGEVKKGARIFEKQGRWYPAESAS